MLQLGDDAEFLLLNCTNTRFRRQPFRHALYYLLNIIALKPPPTRRTAVPERLPIAARVDFESEWEGAWQRLPRQVLDRLDEWKPDLAIKFGMGLMRVPPELRCKVLSYHHGDPRRYRGRPAGFYELLEGMPRIGQIIQVISNRLDGGEVVAFAETSARAHSYRATMDEAYRTSPLLIRQGVRNALAGTVLPIGAEGRNYRLPSNWTVARFAARLFAAKAKRLLYGALFEKAWQVASVETRIEGIESLDAIGDPSAWTVVRMPRRYQFLADPFPHPSSGVLVEALRRSDGQGEIVHVDGAATRTLCSGPGHFSYPATLQLDGDWFMIPEVSEWSGPRLYRLRDDGAAPAGELEIAGSPRLADATLHVRDGLLYLFGNDVSEGSAVLRLWTSPSLSGRFVEHPDSPIRISPAGSRMAGAIFEAGGRAFRIGQDGSRGYGKGIVLFEITALSPSRYAERQVGELSFTGVHGPHTLNRRGQVTYFDFYRERFTPLAGIRRLRAHLSKRKASREAAPSRPLR